MGKKAKWTMEKFLDICFLKDVECLSETYDHSGMKFRCKNCGHRWNTRPENIVTCITPDKKGGCPQCYEKISIAKEGIVKAKAIAKKKNWTLLSTEKDYENAHSLLHWLSNECGHDWPAALSDVQDKPNRKGTGCGVCHNSGKERTDFKGLKKLASFFGITCNSTEYKNCYTMLSWSCKHGHTFDRTADQFNKRPWCPECIKARTITTSDMEIKKLEYLKSISNGSDNQLLEARSDTPQAPSQSDKPQVFRNEISLPVNAATTQLSHSSAHQFGVVCPLCLHPLDFDSIPDDDGNFKVQCASAANHQKEPCSFRVYINRESYKLFLARKFDSLCKVFNEITYTLCGNCDSPVYEKNLTCVKCGSLGAADDIRRLSPPETLEPGSLNDSDIRF